MICCFFHYSVATVNLPVMCLLDKFENTAGLILCECLLQSSQNCRHSKA